MLTETLFEYKELIAITILIILVLILLFKKFRKPKLPTEINNEIRQVRLNMRQLDFKKLDELLLSLENYFNKLEGG